jgi:SSS family solute:Na+ symporter
VNSASRLIDLLLIALYLGLLLVLAYRRGRREDEATREYLLAGRTLTLPAFVATLVSSWYGGVLGVGEYSYLHGLSNWIVLGCPYYIAGLLFAFLLARRARASALVTVPERLLLDHGPAVGTVGTLLVFVNMLPAAYIVMLSVIGRRALGIAGGEAAHIWGIGLALLFSAVYVVGGGFRAVVRTNAVQFLLMYAGFIILLPVAFVSAGGFGALRALPVEHLTWDGGLGFQAVAVWYVIAMQTLVEPTFYQRCYAARGPSVAKRGVLWAIAFWVLFDALTTATGMYARVLVPDLANGVEAYPALADALLPPVARGAFYVGLIATVMSTVESYLFVAATTLGFDLPQAWRAWRGLLSGSNGRTRREGIEQRQAEHRKATRWGLVVATLATFALALTSDSVVALWKGVGSVITPALLLPLVGGFIPRLRAGSRATLASMLLSAAVAVAWMVPAWRGGANPLGLEPIFPALAISIFLHLPAWLGMAAYKNREPRNS